LVRVMRMISKKRGTLGGKVLRTGLIAWAFNPVTP
jgi:hypothetical protein